MQTKWQKVVTIFYLAFIFTCSVVFITDRVNADEGTLLSVEPNSIIDTSIAPNDTFQINVTVTNVTDLFGCQIKLGFSPTVLECLTASLPSDHIFAGQVYSSPPPTIDNTHGTIFVMTIIMGIQPGVNVTKGTFCQITFKVKARGISSLQFLELNKQTYMIDSGGDKISFTPQDGYFSNKLLTPPATLLMDPSRILNPLLTPCNDFIINVTILQATDLYRWQLSVNYRNDILNATNAFEGQFMQSGGSTTFDVQIQNDFNITHGRIIANSTLLGATGVTGNGTLLSIVFHVTGLGNTTINIDEISLYDSQNEAIPYSKYDGYFNNQLIAKLHVIPDSITGPQWVPQTNFTIKIAVEDVEDLYGYEFNLAYDSDILTCYGIILNTPLGEMHFTTSFSINGTLGEVWVKTEFYSPAVPITTYTNLTLVTLFFKVDKIGESTLHLFDTNVTDTEGRPIVHDTTDGYFATLIVDIGILNAEAYPSKVYESWIVTINVTVLNKGDLTETFDIDIYYDNSSVETLTVQNLAPSEERTLTSEWDTTGVIPYCDYNYTIRAEVLPLTYELNKSDNSFTNGKISVKLMGDINGDGVVELLDFSLMTDAYGSYPGHIRWNPDCDLNQDGIVELTDFLVLSNNYGRTCVPHP